MSSAGRPATAPRASRTPSSPSSPSRRPRREPARHPRLVRPARIPPRLARLARDDDRRRPGADAHSGDRARHLRRRHARHRLCDGVAACRGSPRTPTRRRSSSSPAARCLSLSLMLSQAMESVTRAFYARSDLDLLLSSPAPAQKIFAVRIATIALSIIAMAALHRRALRQRARVHRRRALARRLTARSRRWAPPRPPWRYPLPRCCFT